MTYQLLHRAVLAQRFDLKQTDVQTKRTSTVLDLDLLPAPSFWQQRT
jgi:hypothetical protein